MNTATDTRNAAFFQIRAEGKITRQQSLILALFEAFPQNDFSIREVAIRCELDTATVSARLNELKSFPLELIEQAPRRSCSISGRSITPLRLALL